MTESKRPRRRAARGVALAVGILVGGGSAAWAALAPADAVSRRPSSGEVVPVEISEVPLACPPAIIDPLMVLGVPTLSPQSGAQSGSEVSDSAEASGAVRRVFPNHSADSLTGGGDFRLIEADEGPAELSGVTISGASAGDLLSLVAQTCIIPSRSLAFAAGATTVGEDSVLIISNPSDKPVNVSVQVFGEDGALLSSPATLTVGGTSTATVLPGAWSPGVAAPTILVTADGTGVAAWLQTSALDGEVALGLDVVHGMRPETSVVLTGVTASRQSTLRIGNLGSARTEVSVKMLSDAGEEPLDGAQNLPVLAKSTVSVDLAALPSEVHGLVVEGDEELVAMVTEATVGEPHPDVREATYFARTVVGGGRPLTSSSLISARDLTDLIDELGFSEVSVAVAVSNPGEVEAELEIQGASKRLPAASSALYPLIGVGESSQFESDVPVYASYVITASTPAGTVRSVGSLGIEGPLAQSRAVWLFPEGEVVGDSTD